MSNSRQRSPARHLAALAACALLAGSAAQPARAAPGTDWLALSPAQKPPRLAAIASAWDPVSNRMIIFGGYDATSYKNDTWAFDGQTWTKLVTPVAPTPRAAASMAFDSATQQVVLFGGYAGGGQYLGDTWIWDGATGTWSPTSPAVSPKGVTGPMVFTDPANGHADVYGGYDGKFYQLTTYQWTGTTWQLLNTNVTPWARSSAAIALDPVHHNVVMFGGLASVNPWNTWTFDGSDWQMESPATQPPLRYSSSAAFDPHLGGVVVFGGGSGGLDINDTWEWTGSDWTQLQPAHAPAPREAFGMAFDPTLDHIVVVAGQQGNLLLNDTWALHDLGEFLNIGPGIGGSLGAPVLAGTGDLAAGSDTGFTLTLSNTFPSTPVTMFLSLSQGALPLKGGTLYPVPVLLQVGLTADGTGSVALPASIPAGVPGGTSFTLQDWMPDASAPQHFSGSNGLKAIVP